jgi:SAM-dependent methyltransferase
MGGRLYNATWGRVFAATYDRNLRAAEKAGLADQRRNLVARASGATLEIGAGTGANLALYPAGVRRLVLAEPGEHMASRLRSRAAEEGSGAEIVEAPAERLPFEDDSFDTVVSTLVLCTVPDPGAAVAEIARILRPGGRLLFLEHVRGDDGLARWQDRLERPWRFCADGCHCNRDTLGLLQASALEVDDVEHSRLRKMAPINQPLVIGSAVAPAPAPGG